VAAAGKTIDGKLTAGENGPSFLERLNNFGNTSKGVGRKFSRGQRKKDRKLAKKYRKIALFASFRGEGQ